MTLEQTLIQTAQRIRAAASAHNQGQFYFDIKIFGRTDGDANIELRFGANSYDDLVKGNDLEVVLEEWFRRQSWNARNAPLCLSTRYEVEVEPEPEQPQLNPPTTTGPDDLPF